MSQTLQVQAARSWIAAGSEHAPSAEWLPRRTRGRASVLTRMVAEVAQGAAADAGVDLADCPLVVGSAYGELATTMQLLEMMNAGDGSLSPSRFQASVHNTAASVVSIATTNRAFSTTLAAGYGTAAAVLMEAAAWLACNGGFVIAIVADERPSGLFAGCDDEPAAAAALTLLSEPSPAPLASLSLELRDASVTNAAPATRYMAALAAAGRAGRGVELDIARNRGCLRARLTPGGRSS